jgi:hypothetical protein
MDSHRLFIFFILFVWGNVSAQKRGMTIAETRMSKLAVTMDSHVTGGYGQDEAIHASSPTSGNVAIRKGAMRRGITPFGGNKCLAAEAEALEELHIALVSGQLEVIKQLATTGNHLQKTTTCAVVFAVHIEVLGKFVNACRQDSDLDVGAAGVFVVKFEFLGAGSSFAHGLC